MFPFLPCSKFLKNIFLFSRSKSYNNPNVYKELTKYWEQSPYPNLLVYPEETRNQTYETKPLKKGFIQYAYDRQIPVQIFITKNKENVLSLQKNKTSFDQTLYTCFANVINPVDYKTNEDFEIKFYQVWNSTWNQCYHSTETYHSLALEPLNMQYSILDSILYKVFQFVLMMMYHICCYRFPLLFVYPLLGLLQQETC
jgi:hypothetical protein